MIVQRIADDGLPHAWWTGWSVGGSWSSSATRDRPVVPRSVLAPGGHLEETWRETLGGEVVVARRSPGRDDLLLATRGQEAMLLDLASGD